MVRTRRLFMLIAVVVLALAPAGRAAATTPGGSVAPAALAPASLLRTDVYDSADGTWTTAPTLPPVSYHTFGSWRGDYLYTLDEDWFRVSVAQTGTPVIVNVRRTAGQGGSFLDVYGATAGVCDKTSLSFGGFADPNAGPRVLAGPPVGGWWVSGMAKIRFVAPRPGTYFFRHRPAVIGTEGPGYARDAVANAAKTAVSYEMRVVVGDADRLAGTSRYGTSVTVSRWMWNSADDPWWSEGPWGHGVILVSGQSSVDGLAATSLSLRTGMPILLTAKGSLPPEVAGEIHRLASADWWNAWGGGTNRFTVYVCGSKDVISSAVEGAVDADPYVTRVVRLEGPNRYATAAAIADEAEKAALDAGTPHGPAEAFVINGAAWADGLAAGPVAGFAHAPVLMVTKDVLPDATRTWLVANHVAAVHVVGGPSVVATAVLTAIGSLPTSPTVDRLWGPSRYETAYRVARYGVTRYGMSDAGCVVVSGASPWDALSAGQLSFMTYTPLLLTPRDSLSPWVTKFRDDAGGFDSASYVVGGDTVVGPAAYASLRDLWKRH